MSKSLRVHTAEFKARVALAACKGDRTLSEIAAQYQVHNGIEYGVMQLIAEAYNLLRRGAMRTPDRLAEVFDI